MSGKILQVFNFLDIHSNDFLKILLIAGGGWGGGVGGGVISLSKIYCYFFRKKKSILREMGNFGTNLAPKWCVFITLYPLLESFQNFAK